MKNIHRIALMVFLFAAAQLLARQTPAPNPPPNSAPCIDQASSENAADRKKDVIDHDPLVDPAEELRLRAEKKMDEKNFKELQEAAAQLAAVSGKMSMEIDASGQYVFSLRVLDDLDQIEKLTKKVRSRAK